MMGTKRTMTSNRGERGSLALPDWPYGYTDDEITAATLLYEAECEGMYRRGYSGDFGLGLNFVMQTYGAMAWRHYFQRDPPTPPTWYATSLTPL